jgi:hypothetical protein
VIWKKREENIVICDAMAELPGNITGSEFSGISRRSAFELRNPSLGLKRIWSNKNEGNAYVISTDRFLGVIQVEIV